MSFPPFAKAIVAAILTGAAPSVAAATSTSGVTPTSTVESVVAMVLGGLATYLVPNGAKGGVSGLVVTVKTDVDAFLAKFAAGLPALVQSSAEAALAPKADPAPAVEPAPEAPAPSA